MALVIHLKLEKQVLYIPEVQSQVHSNCSVGETHHRWQHPGPETLFSEVNEELLGWPWAAARRTHLPEEAKST